MSLENATKISELVATNPTGADPVSQGDDHLRMVKQVLKNNAIKSEIGQSATPENNFTLDASADNGSMKLARSSGQDIMTVDAAGKVAFPQMGQSFSANGYVKLPGGLIIQWGVDNQATGYRVVTLPIPFPTGMLCGVATMDATGHTPTGSLTVMLLLINATSFGITPRYINNGGQVGEANQACRWIAIGY